VYLQSVCQVWVLDTAIDLCPLQLVKLAGWSASQRNNCGALTP